MVQQGHDGRRVNISYPSTQVNRFVPTIKVLIDGFSPPDIVVGMRNDVDVQDSIVACYVVPNGKFAHKRLVTTVDCMEGKSEEENEDEGRCHCLDLGACNQIGDFFKLQNNLKFFYSDLVDIVRGYPKIAELHKLHIDNQISRLHDVLNEFSRSGRLKKYESSNLYAFLSRQLWLTGSFWLSRCIVRGMKHDMEELQEEAWSLIYPHLTDKGKQELSKLIDIAKFT